MEDRLSMETAGIKDQKDTGQSLTIVIPALNEEEAIGETISQCLSARDEIIAHAGLTDVEIVVVSDGSTDRTAEIAQSFEGVKVIVFKENRGYGAAIKEGWAQGHGTLLGFLDADGTCDPRFFGEMCRIAISDSADIVLGSRLSAQSQMPRVRRIGNRIYAFLLGFFCGRQVTDTASGMRVVQRSSLKDLYPLPNRLHFTPSMSARGMLNNLRLIEIPMTYHERIGDSKLHVVRDGIQFLRTIVESVLCYRPEKIFLMAFSVIIATLLLLAIGPAEFYLQHQYLEEWMIYRFVVCFLLGTVGLMLLLATALSNQMAHFSPRRTDANTFWPSLIAAVLRGSRLLTLIGMLGIVSVLFLWPGITEFVTTGKVYMHWSRLLAGTFTLLSLCQTTVFAILTKVIELWKSEDTFLMNENNALIQSQKRRLTVSFKQSAR